MTDAPDTAIIRLTDVSRRFASFEALKHIDLAVYPGQLVGVIGPSGAGKTTAVRLMTGELLPSEGRVAVFGHEPSTLPSRVRETIGFMPQHFALYEDLTAAENVDFVASMFGLLMFERRRRTRAVLELLGLWDVRGRRAGQLSGGMQRRLQLASALVHDPRLIFLDEPTAGIDPLLRDVIWQELGRAREAGATILVTTQYVTEAERCDVVALIAGGRLLAFEPPDDLRRRAFGGQIVEVTTARPFDVEDLALPPSVEELRQVGRRVFHAVTADAASATPLIVEAVTAAGGTVAAIGEHRPTFDEVFAVLIEQAGVTPDQAAA